MSTRTHGGRFAAAAIACIVAVMVAGLAPPIGGEAEAAQQDQRGLQELLNRYEEMKARGQEAKARMVADPRPETRRAAMRMKNRMEGFADRHVSELLTAMDMAAVANQPRPALKVNTDSFGYQATEVPYNFIGIDNDIGNRILQFGDDISVPVNLEEAFTFYGTSVNTLVMDTNGYVHTWFGGFTSSDFTNDCPLPTPDTGGIGLGQNDAAMFAMWDDLDFRGFGADFGQLNESGMYVAHYPTCPRPNDINGTEEGCTVFMWDNAREWGAPRTFPDWDMEIITYHTTGQWVFQLGDGHPNGGALSTSGSQDFNAIAHLQWDCNEAGSIPGSTAVGYFPPGTAPAARLVAGSASSETLKLPDILSKPGLRGLRR